MPFEKIEGLVNLVKNIGTGTYKIYKEIRV